MRAVWTAFVVAAVLGSFSFGSVFAADFGTPHHVKKKHYARWRGDEVGPVFYYAPVRYYAYDSIEIYRPYPSYDVHSFYSPYQGYYSRYPRW